MLGAHLGSDCRQNLFLESTEMKRARTACYDSSGTYYLVNDVAIQKIHKQGLRVPGFRSLSILQVPARTWKANVMVEKPKVLWKSSNYNLHPRRRYSSLAEWACRGALNNRVAVFPGCREFECGQRSRRMYHVIYISHIYICIGDKIGTLATQRIQPIIDI